MKWLENLFERGRGQTPEGQNPKVDTDASRVSRWGMWVLAVALACLCCGQPLPRWMLGCRQTGQSLSLAIAKPFNT